MSEGGGVKSSTVGRETRLLEEGREWLGGKKILTFIFSSALFSSPLLLIYFLSLFSFFLSFLPFIFSCSERGD